MNDTGIDCDCKKYFHALYRIFNNFIESILNKNQRQDSLFRESGNIIIENF